MEWQPRSINIPNDDNPIYTDNYEEPVILTGDTEGATTLEDEERHVRTANGR